MYKTSKENYLNILSFTTEKYYLHESDLEKPSQNNCYIAQNKVLSDLDEITKNNVKKEIRSLHSRLEYTLLESVLLLKDPNSPYWIRYIEPGTYPEPLYPETIVVRDGTLSKYLKNLKELSSQIQNSEAKKDFEQATLLLQEAITEHNIAKLFEIHKILHDYDYFVFNIPLQLKTAPADWTGVDIYFGKASILN